VETWAGEYNTVCKDFEEDLASGVLVLTVCNRVHQGLAQTIDGILVEAHAVETDDPHRMAGFRSMKSMARSIAIGIGPRMSS